MCVISHLFLSSFLLCDYLKYASIGLRVSIGFACIFRNGQLSGCKGQGIETPQGNPCRQIDGCYDAHQQTDTRRPIEIYFQNITRQVKTVGKYAQTKRGFLWGTRWRRGLKIIPCLTCYLGQVVWVRGRPAQLLGRSIIKGALQISHFAPSFRTRSLRKKKRLATNCDKPKLIY